MPDSLIWYPNRISAWYILTARDNIESFREVEMRRFQLLRRARMPQRVYIMRKFGSKEVKSVRMHSALKKVSTPTSLSTRGLCWRKCSDDKSS
jgi:hypothetical protein